MQIHYFERKITIYDLISIFWPYSHLILLSVYAFRWYKLKIHKNAAEIEREREKGREKKDERIRAITRPASIY